MEKEIQELLEENSYSLSDAEEAINFVAALLTIRLEYIKKMNHMQLTALIG